MPGYSIPSYITCLLITLLLSFSSHGQSDKPKSFSQQLSVITENDRYLLQGKDRYYSNGLMISYSRVRLAKKPSILKQVNQYELGQKLFTPHSRKIYDVSEIDRPVTGYLYAKYTQSRFMVRNQSWQWGLSVGTIGKASLGEAMQNTFHEIINVNSDWWGWIWDYQLKSEPGINLHGRYAKGLLTASNSLLQITPVTQATAGTNFTNISQGVLIQIGKINPHSESAYWNASLQVNQTTATARSEFFFYYHPEIKYQLYNATVQGGLFRKDKGPITSSVEPFVILHQVGALCNLNRYILKLEAVVQSKEARSQRFSHNYGSIQVSYLFN